MTDNSVAKERMHLEEFLRTRRIDGLIAEPVKSGLPNPNLDLYQKLQKSGIPVVFVNSFYENLTIPHVSLDDEKAGYIATKHLWNVDIQESPESSRRMTAGKNAICRIHKGTHGAFT